MSAFGVLFDEAFEEFWGARRPHRYSNIKGSRWRETAHIKMLSEIMNGLPTIHAREDQRRPQPRKIAAPALSADFEDTAAVHLIFMKVAAVLRLSVHQVAVSMQGLCKTKMDG